MHASSLLVLAAGAISSVMAQSTTTSTSTMTQYVTITQCNPTNTACPLYKAPTTSSSIISSTSTSSAVLTTSSSVVKSSSSAVPTIKYPEHNTTVSILPTGYHNATTPKYTVATPTPATLTGVVSTSTPVATVPASQAGALALKSGLMVGALGAAAALLL